MVFSSLNFLFVFLPLVLGAYYIAPRKLRNGILFFFSLIFYAWGEPVYVALVLFSTALDYVCGRMIEKHREDGGAKAALITSVVVNLSLLCIFKYSDFIVTNINALLGTAIPLPGLPLPIGISFYTFQTMSYTIDVYRGDAKMQPNIISFGAYVSLFPQLIAGPIVRFQDVAEQLDHRRETTGDFAYGVRRFLAGLAKKVLLADNIGAVWNAIVALPSGEMSALTAWLGIIAFAFQIYFDFSGYSDMAIGLGKMFGFTFLENFRYPYIAKSITEFWRRWHISLGTWFREYVYIPLGGNQKGIGRQMINIAIVWVLTGIWHGAAWNYVLWGVYFCVFLILEKAFLLRTLQKIPAFFAHLYTLFVVMISWVLFAFEDFAAGLRYLGEMFGAGVPLINDRAIFLLGSNLFFLIILILAATPLPSKLAQRVMSGWEERPTAAGTAIAGLVLTALFVFSVAYLVDSTNNFFLYFRF